MELPNPTPRTETKKEEPLAPDLREVLLGLGLSDVELAMNGFQTTPATHPQHHHCENHHHCEQHGHVAFGQPPRLSQQSEKQMEQNVKRLRRSEGFDDYDDEEFPIHPAVMYEDEGAIVPDKGLDAARFLSIQNLQARKPLLHALLRQIVENPESGDKVLALANLFVGLCPACFNSFRPCHCQAIVASTQPHQFHDRVYQMD
jgi:hypothetical protein